MIEVNGIAHIILVVNRFDICKPFYQKILSFMGLKEVFNGAESLYYVGGKTAIGIGPSEKSLRHEKFNQLRIGLHHFCLRSRSREDVDALYEFLKGIDAKIIHPPEDGPWAPGYYSVLFEDPDGLRIEVNHVPGRGVLEEGKAFNPAGDYK